MKHVMLKIHYNRKDVFIVNEERILGIISQLMDKLSNTQRLQNLAKENDLAYKPVMDFSDEAIDNIIDSIRPLMVDGVESNLSATDIIRSNDAYNGYAGNDNVPGTMSRSDAVMVLAKALVNASRDPVKKSTMIDTALKEYSNGNIIMKPEGSFTRLLATKGFESIAS